MSVGRFLGRAGVLVVAAIGLLACSSKPSFPPPPPLAARDIAPIVSDAYLIAPGDEMEVKFFFNPELTDRVTVRNDGRISLQIVGDVMAAGRTVEELQKALSTAYQSELQRPQIAVVMRSFAPTRVFVGGQVQKPGIIESPIPITLPQAIAMAGGLKDEARSDSVLLVRRGPGGQPLVYQVTNDQVDGAAPEISTVALANYDFIYAPRSAISEVNKFVEQYIKNNVPNFSIGYTFGNTNTGNP